ncbi:MAG: hypothetical protein IJO75_01625 [Clostridia bacterium]|nr:hypothetical protein [Clostridia bacterium]
MNGYITAVSLLPKELQVPLLLLDKTVGSRVQEIRLRSGQAVSLGFGGEEWFVTAAGKTTGQRACGIVCSEALLRQTADRLLEYSVYAHWEELRRGFVTAGGCRVGIAGTAVLDSGAVAGYRAISALCIRVRREHDGCAERLMPFLCDDGVHSALICSEPAGGKTSVLRDLATQLAQRRLPITVIDERGELSGGRSLLGCDVLCYTPKAAGIEQAVRCLAPRAVLLDELGDADELSAVYDGFLRGVPTVATVHARSFEELYRRDGLRDVLERGVFEYLIQLHGRQAPGEIAQVLRTEEWLRENVRNRGIAADGFWSRIDRAAHFETPRQHAVVV